MDLRARLAVIAVTAIIAAVAMVGFTESVERRVEAGRDGALLGFGEELVDVMVATEDISIGDRLSQENLRIEPWPPVLLPRGALSASETIEGMVASAAILAGEVVSDARVGTNASGFTVPDGLTAVTVPSAEVRAVGGAVRAGSRVDVYSARGGSAELIATEVEVLATSASTSGSSGPVAFGLENTGIEWVTLAVVPQGAEQIIAAADSGTLYFTLPPDE